MLDVRSWLSSISEKERRYNLEFLCEELSSSEEFGLFFAFLTNFDFLEIKISVFGIQKLIEDYDELSHPHIVKSPEYNSEKAAALRLVQKTLQQVAHILEEDRTQLPSQLLLHLLPLNNPALKKLLKGEKGREGEADKKGAKECDLYPWLEPLMIQSANLADNLARPIQKTIVTSHNTNLDALAISADACFAASASGMTVKIWDLSTGQKTQSFEFEVITETDSREELKHYKYNIFANVTALALSSDGRWAAVGLKPYGYSERAEQLAIEIWDLEAKQRLIRFRIGSPVKSLAISQSGQYLVGAFEGGWNYVWMLSQDHSQVIISTRLSDPGLFGEGKKVAISPNGRWVATTNNLFLFLWDLIKGRLRGATRLFCPEKNVAALAFSSEGKITAVFEDGSFKIWHIPYASSFDLIDEESESLEEGLRILKRQYSEFDSRAWFHGGILYVYRILLFMERGRHLAFWLSRSRCRRRSFILGILALEILVFKILIWLKVTNKYPAYSIDISEIKIIWKKLP